MASRGSFGPGIKRQYSQIEEDLLAKSVMVQDKIQEARLIDQKKLIDFNQLSQDYKTTTEQSLPFTRHQIEDVIFIKKGQLISLESIFYEANADTTYSKLRKLPQLDNKSLQDEVQATFQPIPHEYIAHKANYLDSKKQTEILTKIKELGQINTASMTKLPGKKLDARFMNIEGESGLQREILVEALLCVWQITKQGQLRRLKQVSFDYHPYYVPTQEKNMRLQLSHDCKYVSLALLLQDKVHMLAWKTKNLEPLTIKPALQSNLKLLLQSQFDELIIVGESQHVLLTQKRIKENRRLSTHSINYRIFSLASGNLLFEYENVQGAEFQPNQDNMFCLGLIFHRKIKEGQIDKEAVNDDISLEFQSQDDQSQDSDDEGNLLQKVLAEVRQAGTIINPNDQSSESEGEEIILEGGDESLNMMVSAFFVTNSAVPKTSEDIKKYPDWHAVRLEIDLSQRAINENLPNELQKEASALFQKMIISGEQQNLYQLPKNWLLNSQDRLDYYLTYVSIVTNRRGNYFGFLNTKRKYFIAFCQSPKNQRVKILDTHKYSNLREVKSCHARNPQTKDNLFLHMEIGTENWIQVFFDDIEDQRASQMRMSQPVVDMRALSADYMKAMSFMEGEQIQFSTRKAGLRLGEKVHGAWVDAIYHQYDGIIQGTSLTLDREVQLKTSSMDMQSRDQITWVQNKRISKSQRIQASFPIIAYNIGIQKMIFQITTNVNKTIVYELPSNEFFVDFLQFCSLKDLNFKPRDRIYDACSSFVFLTARNTPKGPRFVVNLMLIDPYMKFEAFVLYKSDNAWDKHPGQLTSDEIKNCIIYSTKGTSGVANQNIRVLLQYQNQIEFIHMSETKDNYDVNDDESEDLSIDSYRDEFDEEEIDDEKTKCKYEPVKAIINSKGHVYYVTNYEGQCTIWEINTYTHENVAQKIYEIRTSECLGFSHHNDHFYLMDDTKTINKLKQNSETRLLDNIEDLYMKERDKPNFNQVDFAQNLVRDQFVLYNSGLFYLYKDVAFEDGILDFEELLENQENQEVINTKPKHLIHGVTKMEGSEQFVIVNQIGKGYEYQINVYQMPDSMHITMMKDRAKHIDFATFLYEGKILLKMGKRFMQFNEDGKFINEVEFRLNSSLQQKRQSNIVSNMARKFKNYTKAVMLKKAETKKFQSQLEDEMPVNVISQNTNLHLMFEVSRNNDMTLLQMSDDSKYFLFEDNEYKLFSVYTIKRVDQIEDDDSDYEDHEMQFVKLYDVPWQQSEVIIQIQIDEDVDNTSKLNFPQNEENQKKQILEFKDLSKAISNELVKTSLGNDASVVFIHTQRPKEIFEPQLQTQLTVMGCKFIKTEEGNDVSNIDFKQIINFPNYPIKDVDLIISKQQAQAQNLLKIEKAAQKRLPEVFRSSQKMDQLSRQLDIIKKRKQMRYSSQIIGKYLIVQCGRYIKVAILEEKGKGKKKQHLYQDQGKNNGLEFKILNLNFPYQIEITKLLSVTFKQKAEDNVSENLIQIVAKDNMENIMIVTTWDCHKNIEYSMYQTKCEQNQNPENYVIRGMNNKLNYFMDEHQVYDLEYEIPQQIVVQNPLTGNGIGYKYLNQRKIFWDTSRYLSLEQPNTLFIPQTRRDLSFWKSIASKNEDIGTIAENTEFRQFNQVFGGHTLFHHFAKDRKVIEMLHQKYVQLRDDDDVEKEDFNTPLMLLSPDLNGKTALDIAIEADRLVCFELMLDMLEDYNNKCLSKMMLGCIPHMVLARSEIIYKYFDTCLYQPFTMAFDHRIPWPHDLKEVTFASHTVLISEDMLLKEIGKAMSRFKWFGGSEYLGETAKWLNKVQAGITSLGKDDQYQKITESQVGAVKKAFDTLEDKVKFERQVVRGQILDEETETKKEKASIKRVKMECLDFDWIFNMPTVDGDKTCNALSLLHLLSEEDVHNKLYKQTSIRVFVQLLWSLYRPRIIRWKLVPFLVYLAVQNFVTLAGSSLIDEIKDHKELSAHPDAYYYCWLYYSVVGCCFFIQFYWLTNLYSEGKEWMRDGLDYFKDVWNYLDFSITVISQLYMVQFMTDLMAYGERFPVAFMRTCGGMTLFLLWIKMFYWMRLFNQTAYFIKLIEQTLADLKQFFYIILIIAIAFVSIFFVFSCNLPDEVRNTKPYVADHTGIKLIDAIVTVYFISVGEFFTENFSQPPNNVLIWPMFIACNFLMAIVFMNMLIAIMGETYSQVTSTKVESGLEQEIALMTDYEDLFDMRKRFSGKKYVIHALPAVTETSREVDLEEEITQLGITIPKSVNRRIDEADRNNRLLLKHQNGKISQIMRSMNNILNQYTKSEQR